MRSYVGVPSLQSRGGLIIRIPKQGNVDSLLCKRVFKETGMFVESDQSLEIVPSFYVNWRQATINKSTAALLTFFAYLADKSKH